MSRDRARSRSADAAGGILGRPLAIAATSAWLVYWAVYAITFALTGQPVAVAIRGGFANAFPDGLLLLVALRVSRRLDRDGAAVSALVRGHAVVAAVAIPLAAAAKMTFIWVDMVVIHHFKFQFSWGTVTWQMLLSTMMYVAVSAMAHTWLIAQRLRDEEEHAVRADALRVRAEMAALRAQLNPHFLFNTLHSVLGLVRRDPALAESALEKLGDMLHYATRVHRDGVDWTSLRQERKLERRDLRERHKKEKEGKKERQRSESNDSKSSRTNRTKAINPSQLQRGSTQQFQRGPSGPISSPRKR